ncbi:MAG: hypothetical protein U5L98_17280 [Halomonas sp.]|uniref:hypothetical protein n=1 Tax=Halomonas sp. TaxID=1486246 RepID=UPI002ACEF991|nr:hypothetical protein [Halomonas sp.]MDZ7854328.1 hypothetical protein [Halomonas sp.]
MSSGAEKELEQATQLARRMVARWGMSERIGPVMFAREPGACLPGQGDGSVSRTQRSHGGAGRRGDKTAVEPNSKRTAVSFSKRIGMIWTPWPRPWRSKKPWRPMRS